MRIFKRKKVEEVKKRINVDNERILQLERKLKDKEECNVDLLIRVNELLQLMTQQDYVRGMIVDIREQGEMVENVAASSEELSTATEDISNFVQESNNATHDGIEVSKNSVSQINESFGKIEETMEKTNEVRKIMDLVNKEAKKIDDMVEIIENVADRTNLLALNASIEAARAGEHGRGFSVVADEIKKLAESTKKQVEFIRDVVTSLTTEISRTSLALDEATFSFKNSKSYIDDAVKSINSINDVLETIGNSFSEISANIEEQTAATEEIAGNIMVINEKTVNLKENTIKTGDAFYKISNLIDEIRILAYEEAECIDPKAQIEICISDHLMWKWRVYNMILGYEKLDESSVGTHHTCRLGKWVDSQNITDPKIKEIFAQLEEPHARLHDLAREAIRLYNDKDTLGAERALESMDLASRQVVRLLNELKTMY